MSEGSSRFGERSNQPHLSPRDGGSEPDPAPLAEPVHPERGSEQVRAWRMNREDPWRLLMPWEDDSGLRRQGYEVRTFIDREQAAQELLARAEKAEGVKYRVMVNRARGEGRASAFREAAALLRGSQEGHGLSEEVAQLAADPDDRAEKRRITEQMESLAESDPGSQPEGRGDG